MVTARREDDMPRSRIPEFSSVEEEAKFWDTHDTTEFEDEWEEVTDIVFVAAQPKDGIWLRFDDAVLAELTRIAREQKSSPQTLARRWVLQRLQNP